MEERLVQYVSGTELGAQALMDAVTGRVMTKLLVRFAVSNNLLTTDEGFVLDARQGKELKTSIDTINRDLVHFSRIDMVFSDYVTKLDWGNHITGSKSFFIINLALTATKAIPRGTVIGTLPFPVLESSVWLISPPNTKIIVYNNNIRIDDNIQQGASIFAYIPTCIQ